MKKSFSHIILFLILLLKINFSFAQNLVPINEREACSNFYNAIKNDEMPFLKGIYPAYNYEDFGFYFKTIWDSKKDKYVEERDENGNLKVGEIYSMQAYNSLRTEDSIIKINNKKIKTTEEFNEIFREDIKKIKIELKDSNGEIYLVYLDKHLNEYNHLNYSLIDFNISDLDLKKGFYDVTINQSFQYEYTTIDNLDDNLHEYVQLGHKYLIGKLTEDSEEDYYHICKPTEKEMIDNEIIH